MKKIVTVLGARPQFIKASVVSHAIKKADNLKEVLVHTGQHFDANMSEVFFSELDMCKPDYFLDIHGGTHGAMTGRMLAEVERVLLFEKPDVVLVYGDTNSTLAGALAAVKLHIPVAHVEAGLRSFNMAMPEEVNRILTDRISRWLFAPSDVAVGHLRREGFAAEQIINVGDVMLDVALHHGGLKSTRPGLLEQFEIHPGEYVLATIHRAENTDHPERLGVIVNALLRVAAEMPVIWPLHPRTRAILQQLHDWELLKRRIHITEPLGYLDMIGLEKNAGLIATDSGGMQKEAFFHKVPCVTLRDETEWVELVHSGWNLLQPPIDDVEIAKTMLARIGVKGENVAPYGEGGAARKIVSVLHSAS